MRRSAPKLEGARPLAPGHPFRARFSKLVVVFSGLAIAAIAATLTVGSTASAGHATPAAAKQYVFVFVQFPPSEGEFPDAVWEVSGDGHAVRAVIPSNSDDDPSAVRWSPDGTTLAMSGIYPGSGQTNVLLLTDPNGGHRREIDGKGACWDELCWLPDNRSIACTYGRRIRIIDTQSGRSRVLRIPLKSGQANASLNAIDWSPNGDRFAVDDDADGIDLASASGRVLATTSKQGSWPRWSPDGKHILFIEPATSGDTIVIADPTGKHRRVVISTPVFDAAASAAWSPDGESIAYIGQNGLHLVDLQTGTDRMLNRLAKICGPNPQPGCADLDWRAVG